MVHEIIEPSPDFAAGAFAGKEQERKEIAAYVHENLAPELMSAAFSVESIRLQLEKEGHPCAAKIKEIQQLLKEPLLRMTEELNKKVATVKETDLLSQD